MSSNNPYGGPQPPMSGQGPGYGPGQPVSPYGVSKLAAGHYLLVRRGRPVPGPVQWWDVDFSSPSGASAKALDAVCAKTKWWLENHEVHSTKATGPFVARDTFVVRFDIDLTEKNSGQRFQGSEVGIYKVKDGRVVREEFLPMI